MSNNIKIEGYANGKGTNNGDWIGYRPQSESLTGEGEFSNQFITGFEIMEGTAARNGADPQDKYGITGLKAQFKRIYSSGPYLAMYTYDLSWKDHQRLVSAFFSTTVRGTVKPFHIEDKDQFGFLNQNEVPEMNLENNIPYGLMTDPRRSRLALSSFKTDLKQEQLPSFSFLTADNLPQESQFVVGVYHPKGDILNDEVDADVGFDVVQTEYNEFVINFDTPFQENPTIVIFPLWFPNTEYDFPKSMANITTCLRDASKNHFRVLAGAGTEVSDTRKYLGFSFLALDGNTEVNEIVHGVVTVTVDGTTVTAVGMGKGFSNDNTNPDFKDVNPFDFIGGHDNAVNFLSTGKFLGGIEITFDDPFKGIPSVIVSPLTSSNLDCKETDKCLLPVAVVEHITNKKVFIKVGLMNTLTPESSSYEPISFHFVAFGARK